MLLQMSEDGESVLNVDCHNVYAFDQTLYGHLVNYPAEVTSLLDAETRNLLVQLTDRSPDEFEDVMVCHFGFHPSAILCLTIKASDTTL